MRVAFRSRFVPGAAALAPLLFLGSLACSPDQPPIYTPPDEKPEFSNFRVTGKVTHQGKPVPYGYVLFYGIKGVDKAGKTPPPTVAKIWR